jgi:hypothetical protein
MPFELGWAFGNKMGMSDERVQFRELFRNDRNFHNEIENRCNLSFLQPSALGPDSKPDNWRCGALWYQRSYDMVDAGSNPARSPLMSRLLSGSTSMRMPFNWKDTWAKKPGRPGAWLALSGTHTDSD